MRTATTGAIAGLAVLFGAAMSTLVLAQPAEPPLPPPRPDRSAQPAPESSTAGSPTVIAQPAEPPLPPPRPEPSAQPAPERSTPTAPDAAALAPPPGADPNAPCPERLARLGARFEEREPVRENACGVEDAVLLSALPDGVAVKPPALMTCPLAESLSRWTLDSILPEADRHLSTAPTAVLIGTSYQCRNQRSGTKLSEHALGNAVDIMAFEFARRAPVGVAERADGSPEGVFQSAVQKGACAFFNTVLGPGSDAAHGDHLHLDMRGRRGDYRICQ